ncbi:MAG: hypothetical protein KBG75_01655 [Pseudomonadales bacterium]|nr:hypothetical protein [Pseudomonadales bacterium]
MPSVSLAEHFEKVMKPELTEGGYTVTKTYELPETEALELEFANTSGAMEFDAAVERVELLGVEAQQTDGSMSLSVMQQTTTVQGSLVQRLVQFLQSHTIRRGKGFRIEANSRYH